jgi:hypothetical protein
MVQHDSTTRASLLSAFLTEIGIDAILEAYDASGNVLATFEDVNFTNAGVSATLTASVSVLATRDGQVVRTRLYNVARTRYQEIVNPTNTEIQLSTFFVSAGVSVTLSGYTIGAPQ